MPVKEFKLRTTKRERHTIDYEFIKEFINEFDTSKLWWEQFRCLWTSFCMRYNTDPDTGTYDYMLNILYVLNRDAFSTKFPTFEEFDLYMGEYLC